MWVNYLSNGLKYGGRPPRLQLGGRCCADGTVCFWVRDNGPGLTPEDQAALFTTSALWQGVPADGHGLGLAIVRRIVERLGGRVTVKSRLGRGSTFAFALPGLIAQERCRATGEP